MIYELLTGLTNMIQMHESTISTFIIERTGLNALIVI